MGQNRPTNGFPLIFGPDSLRHAFFEKLKKVGLSHPFDHPFTPYAPILPTPHSLQVAHSNTTTYPKMEVTGLSDSGVSCVVTVESGDSVLSLKNRVIDALEMSNPSQGAMGLCVAGCSTPLEETVRVSETELCAGGVVSVVRSEAAVLGGRIRCGRSAYILGVSVCGTYLFAMHHHTIQIFNTTNHTTVCTITNTGTFTPAFSPSGSLAVGHASAKQVDVYTPEGSLLSTLSTPSSPACAYTPNGALIVVASSPGNTVQVWEDNKLVRSFDALGTDIESVAVTERYLAYVSKDTVVVVDYTEGKVVATVATVDASGVAAAEGGEVVGACSLRGVVRCWRDAVWTTPTEIHGAEGTELSDLVLSTERDIAVAAGQCKVYLWSLSGGVLLHTLPSAEWSEGFGLALTPSGRWLFVGRDTEVEVVDLDLIL